LFNLNLEQPSVKPLTTLLTIEPALLRHQLVTYIKTQKPREDDETVAPRAPTGDQSVTPSAEPQAPSKPPLSSEELDKTIERILDEKVL